MSSELLGSYLQERKVVASRQKVYFALVFLGFILWNVDLTRVSLLRSINNWLKNTPPVKLILGCYCLNYFFRNIFLITGLGEVSWPDHKYSPHYKTIRWLFTGLDAGVCSTLKVRNKYLRDFATTILVIYYLVFSRAAEDKMNRMNQVANVKTMRACWEKNKHPVLKRITRMLDSNKKIQIHRRLLQGFLREDDHSHIPCYLYYQGSDDELAKERKVVLHFHGGGFVSMNPILHENYLNHYADTLKCPIVSVDYRKAPEHPFPAAFNDAYDTYMNILDTRGAVIGIKDVKDVGELKVCLTGDSAGGNLCCGVTFKVLSVDQDITRRPAGIVMQYPALDLDSSIWQITEARKDMANMQMSTDDWIQTKYGCDPLHNFSRSFINDSGTAMSTRVQHFDDTVLPMKYLVTILRSYLPVGTDPSDPRVSPLRTPAALLEKFPPLYVNVGEVDPLLGDSRRLIRRMKMVNPDIPTELVEIRGCSHAYMACPKQLLPEANIAVSLSVQWIAKVLGINLQMKINPKL